MSGPCNTVKTSVAEEVYCLHNTDCLHGWYNIPLIGRYNTFSYPAQINLMSYEILNM